MASPSATVGGGVVTDPLPGHRRAKPWAKADEGAPQWIAAMARDAGHRGLSLSEVPVRAGLRSADVAAAVAAVGSEVEVIGGVVYDRAATVEAGRRLLAVIDAHHAAAPLEEGVSLQSLRSAFASGPKLVDELIHRLEQSGAIGTDHGVVRRADWVVRPSPEQQAVMGQIAASVRAAGREPPTVAELAAAGQAGPPGSVLTLLRLLERRGFVRQVEPDRFYSVDALTSLTRTLREGMASGREYGPSELRELLGVSRKYLIPLLEYYDQVGVTERRTSGRVIRQAIGS
jgi:selenocysteine-specific elongation factor